MKNHIAGLCIAIALIMAFSGCTSFLDSVLDVAFDTGTPSADESGEGRAVAAAESSKEEPSGSEPKFSLPPTMMQPFVNAIFTVFFYHGGYTFEAKEYKPGEWTRWRATGMEQGEEFEKAFLARMGDESEWWQVIVRGVEDGETEEIILEALFSEPEDEYRQVLRLRALFPGDDEPSEIPVEADSSMWVMPPAAIDDDDFEGAKKGKEKVTVPAGTFNADRIAYQDPRGKAEWWLVPLVPGGIVKYQFTDADGSSYTGELVEFGKKAETRLQSY